MREGGRDNTPPGTAYLQKKRPLSSHSHAKGKKPNIMENRESSTPAKW